MQISISKDSSSALSITLFPSQEPPVAQKYTRIKQPNYLTSSTPPVGIPIWCLNDIDLNLKLEIAPAQGSKKACKAHDQVNEQIYPGLPVFYQADKLLDANVEDHSGIFHSQDTDEEPWSHVGRSVTCWEPDGLQIAYINESPPTTQRKRSFDHVQASLLQELDYDSAVALIDSLLRCTLLGGSKAKLPKIQTLIEEQRLDFGGVCPSLFSRGYLEVRFRL